MELSTSKRKDCGKKFYDRISSPVLTDLKVEFEGVETKEVIPKKPADKAGRNDHFILQGDCGPFMAGLQHSIKKAWFPPIGLESKKVVVKFKVHRDGTISELKIHRSSGRVTADEAALRAITKAAPFHAVPAGAPEMVDI
jgi:TonB family protein